MVIFFSVLTLLYCFLLLTLIKGWRTIQNNNQPLSYPPKLSVIIPIRNERRHILNLLNDLEKQTYPRQSFEVIVIDDQSEDGGFELIREHERLYGFSLRLFRLEGDASPTLSTKKKAITLGVNNATGDFILTTDGDCRVQPRWLEIMAGAVVGQNLNFGAGMVTFTSEKTLFERLQTLEFASLTGVGAASLRLGFPNMCNAANMIFRKSVFLKAGGYSGMEHIISGDDEFLLQKFHDHDRRKVGFIKNNKATVYTTPQESLAAFYSQRKRWASKWKLRKDKKTAALALFIFAYHASLLIAATNVIAGAYPLLIFSLQFLAKTLTEFAFLINIFNFLGKVMNAGLFILLQLLYPFYAVIMGIAANFGGYRWKGRKYKRV